METKNADLSSLRIDRNNELKNPERRGKMFKIIGTAAGITIFILVIYFGWSALTDSAIEVKLTTAALQSPAQTNAVLTANGYVVAQRKAAVASKGTGRLVYLGFVEGDRVQKNQVIARIDDSDIRAQLEQTKANLKLSQAELIDAENNYERQKELFKTGSTSQADLDAAQSRYNRVLASIEVAKAQVLGVEVAMENTLIRAPFDGTVLTKNADVGEVVAPLGAGANAKAAVVLMADMSSLKAEVDVSESNIEKIIVNQDCEIRLDAYPDYAYPGYVSKIVPTADRSKATVMVKVGFKSYDQRVLPEMSTKVIFLNEKMKKDQSARGGAKGGEEAKQFLVVPIGSVVNRNGSNVVYIVRDERAVEIPVTTGREHGSFIEIKSGLMNGDKIIATIDEKIKDGVKVKLK